MESNRWSVAGTGPDPHLPVCVAQTLQILYGPDPDRPGLDPSNRGDLRHAATKGEKANPGHLRGGNLIIRRCWIHLCGRSRFYR